MALPLECSEEMMEESPDVSGELLEMARYRNQLPPEVVSIQKDLTAFTDANIVQNNRVFPGMMTIEKISAGYVNNYFRTVQDEITPGMKSDVSVWMFEICEEEKVNNAVFIRAAQYMDKFLSSQRISKNQLQLLGAVCVLVSSKIAGTTIPSDRLVAYTANSITRDMLLNWETMLLKVLQWDTYGIVSADFVQPILNFLPRNLWEKKIISERIKTYGAFCAVDYQLGVFLPSIIAAASIVAAISPDVSSETLNQVLSMIHQATSIDKDQIKDCMEQMTAKVRFQITEGNGEQGRVRASSDKDSLPTNGCVIKAR